jgi:hypothetical protein
MESRGVRERHPSGRPIRRENRRTYQDGYRNEDGPRTVRLRRDRNTQAIGFFADITADQQEE